MRTNMQVPIKILNRLSILGMGIFICSMSFAQARKLSSAADVSQKSVNDIVAKAKAEEAAKAKAATLAAKTSTSAIKSSLGSNQTDKDGQRATGVIKDAATGKPLSGVNITIPDFSAALTDDKGNFSIKVPSYTATLLISGDGFQSKEISLKGQTKITASLYEASFTSMFDDANLPFGNKPHCLLYTSDAADE